MDRSVPAAGARRCERLHFRVVARFEPVDLAVETIREGRRWARRPLRGRATATGQAFLARGGGLARHILETARSAADKGYVTEAYFTHETERRRSRRC
jgi:hypothetical protein